MASVVLFTGRRINPSSLLFILYIRGFLFRREIYLNACTLNKCSSFHLRCIRTRRSTRIVYSFRSIFKRLRGRTFNLIYNNNAITWPRFRTDATKTKSKRCRFFTSIIGFIKSSKIDFERITVSISNFAAGFNCYRIRVSIFVWYETPSDTQTNIL